MRPGRRGWAVVTLCVVAGALLLLGLRFADEGMTYYRTPSEAAGLELDEQVRLSGLVVVGSMTRSGSQSSFLLTDGAADVTVRYDGALPATVREGEGAVVDGRLVGGGVVHADEVLLRHSNEYRPAGADP